MGPRSRGFARQHIRSGAMHLQHSGKHLMDEFTTEVERGTLSVTGRAHFGKDSEINMIATVLEEGRTIRAKNAPYLKFKLHRQFSRRAWTFDEPTQWVQVKQVEIPAYLHFEEDWEAHAPTAMRMIEAETQTELEAA